MWMRGQALENLFEERLHVLGYTPIKSRRGRVTHVTSLHNPHTTACGKKCGGWVVTMALVDCIDCNVLVHEDCDEAETEE